MEEVLKRMGRLAAADLSVLITGEDGVGKTAAARYIHAHSTRKNGPLVVFAPARLPSARVEVELFGKGGKLEKAKGGTLVIQQVEQLVPEIQEKLLAALENGEYLVPGGGFTPLDARVIATTSRDLPRMVVEGGFNEDLFLRLQTFTVEIPPLRERAEDVPLLAEYFLKRVAGKRKVRGFTSQAMEALMKYRWPGNVKELKEVIERLVPLARGQPISVDLLPLVIRENREQPAFIAYLREEVKRMLKEGEKDIYGKIVGQVEKVLLEEVLSQTQGNQIMASRILGVHRNTVRRKLSVFGDRGR
ncbi:MAG: two-component system response regulator, partial [Aquificota bacterium]